MSLVLPASLRGARAGVRVKRPGDRRSLSRSATRALDLLEYFGEQRRPLRAIEIARALGMHPSTTNQLLKTMVDSAHLVFNARDKTYLPSPRLGHFSTWIVGTYGLGGRLRELVRDVQAQTGAVVTVTTPNDLFMQIIDLAKPPGQTSERGWQISLFGSAIGSAYLSTLDDAEVLRLADRARIPDAEMLSVLEGAARIRCDGYADGASSDHDMWSVAMPLPIQGRGIPAVLGLAGPPAMVRDRLDHIVAIMHEAIGRWARQPET